MRGACRVPASSTCATCSWQAFDPSIRPWFSSPVLLIHEFESWSTPLFSRDQLWWWFRTGLGYPSRSVLWWISTHLGSRQQSSLPCFLCFSLLIQIRTCCIPQIQILTEKILVNKRFFAGCFGPVRLLRHHRSSWLCWSRFLKIDVRQNAGDGGGANLKDGSSCWDNFRNLQS